MTQQFAQACPPPPSPAAISPSRYDVTDSRSTFVRGCRTNLNFAAARRAEEQIEKSISVVISERGGLINKKIFATDIAFYTNFSYPLLATHICCHVTTDEICSDHTVCKGSLRVAFGFWQSTATGSARTITRSSKTLMMTNPRRMNSGILTIVLRCATCTDY
eukprot:scaffold385983_cov18-Prasinocladus_malaysianus.AAC.1